MDIVRWTTAHPLHCNTTNNCLQVPSSIAAAGIQIRALCGQHDELYEFPFDSNGKYIIDICMNRFCTPQSREQCEELADYIFEQWHQMRYFPSLHLGYYTANCSVDNYKSDFLATRGTILALVTEKYDYKTYLEIGTAKDEIFSTAKQVFPVAIGVDPMSGGTHRMTSDQFFLQQQQQKDNENRRLFDMIFIDGLHEAHQVYIDVMNAIKILAPNGTIILHDCNPHGDLSKRAAYPQASDVIYWNGNTWKAIVALRLVSNIDLVVVDVDHGVGVLKVRDNCSPLSPDWQHILPSNSADVIDSLTDDYLRLFRNDLLPLVSVGQMLDWLDSGSC